MFVDSKERMRRLACLYACANSLEPPMAYKLDPNMMYMMPTHFGPNYGPRQGAGGARFILHSLAKQTRYGVSFLTNREQLEDLLPEGFHVGTEPIVSVEATMLSEIPWLAGRGYNTLGVRFPAVFRGKKDSATGTFLAVLWENLTEPILTGREELGFSKVYADISTPRAHGNEIHIFASWMGFKFLELKLAPQVLVGLDKIPDLIRQTVGDGILHFKYIPRTGGGWEQADACYATLSPINVSGPNGPSGDQNLPEMWLGEGSLQFHRASWEDMPTQFHIVNALNQLEVKKYLGASVLKTVQATDFKDQRILQ
jgi:Acetoacetate decarboxylase (ADC)